jgi:hydrogenase/urease accessory protein HupE
MHGTRLSIAGAAALLAAGLLLGSGAAWCHATKLSSARIEVHGGAVRAQLELNGRDVEVALGKPLLDAQGLVAEDALRALEPALAGYLGAQVRVLNRGEPCPVQVGDMLPKTEHLLVHMEWACPPGRLRYEVGLFQEVDPAARHMVTVGGDVKRMALLSVNANRLSLSDVRETVGEVLWRFFLAGVEHIAIGYDHIAFLVAVILWGRRPWPLVGVVTAFTVAHSITLTLAVLDVVQLPARWVEVLIGASIVYVAAENFVVRDLRHRAWITFVFGLIHGFGFASVLRSYGLERDAVLPALAAFNVGVEVGQVVIVVLALVAMRGAERLMAERFPRIVRGYPFVLSGLILLLGLYWTFERLLWGA